MLALRQTPRYALNVSASRVDVAPDFTEVAALRREKPIIE